jgi:hypothetical protein
MTSDQLTGLLAAIFCGIVGLVMEIQDWFDRK